MCADGRFCTQTQRYLLCLAVGAKQKATVSALVSKVRLFFMGLLTQTRLHVLLTRRVKFDLRHFSVMLWHYDNRVDEWKDEPWFDLAIHVR